MENNTDKKQKQFFDLINETLKRILNKGFYGNVKFCLKIQDGTIQEVEKEEKETYR